MRRAGALVAMAGLALAATACSSASVESACGSGGSVRLHGHVRDLGGCSGSFGAPVTVTVHVNDTIAISLDPENRLPGPLAASNVLRLISSDRQQRTVSYRAERLGTSVLSSPHAACIAPPASTPVLGPCPVVRVRVVPHSVWHPIAFVAAFPIGALFIWSLLIVVIGLMWTRLPEPAAQSPSRVYAIGRRAYISRAFGHQATIATALALSIALIVRVKT